MFVAKTPEQFVELLKAVRRFLDGEQDADKITAYFKANPNSTHQAAGSTGARYRRATRPPTTTVCTPSRLTNAKGDKHVIKWKFVPVTTEPGLSDEQAKGKGDDFYAGELKDRLAKGPPSSTSTPS